MKTLTTTTWGPMATNGAGARSRWSSAAYRFTAVKPSAPVTTHGNKHHSIFTRPLEDSQ
ncbi:MAG: hypothetical protein KDA95_02020 [Acidimicrobiales bacterium]|nr:hypothetical protein [Acidimicrobiales bacterium]